MPVVQQPAVSGGDNMVRSHHTRRAAQMCLYMYRGFIQPCSTIEWNKSRKNKCRIKTSQPVTPPQKKSSGRKHTKTFLKSPNFYGNIRLKQVTDIYSTFMSTDVYLINETSPWSLRVLSNCCMAKPGNPSPRSAPIRQQLSPKVERPPAETGSG